MSDENLTQLNAASTEQQALALVREAFGAARAGDTAALAELLARGVPANVRTEKGDSLLMLATYHGHAAAAHVLLAHGADPELANDRGQTPLGGAAFKGDVTCARLLLDHGACVDTPMADGKTAVTLAAMFDHVALLELLHERGAKLAEQTAPLELARAMGATRAVAWLETRTA